MYSQAIKVLLSSIAAVALAFGTVALAQTVNRTSPAKSSTNAAAEESVWRDAIANGTVDALKSFYEKFPRSNRVTRIEADAEWTGRIKLPNGSRMRIDMLAGESLMHPSALEGEAEIAIKGSVAATATLDVSTAIKLKLLTAESHPSGAVLVRKGFEPKRVSVAYHILQRDGVENIVVLAVATPAKVTGTPR